ncbi:MAG TPA: hypothetical protein VNI77_11945 [Nitrososphaera sp.]|nr:hypothetical protein [Nitrososphaera sp.]
MRTALLVVIASTVSAGLTAAVFAGPLVLSGNATATDSKIDAFDTSPRRQVAQIRGIPPVGRLRR